MSLCNCKRMHIFEINSAKQDVFLFRDVYIVDCYIDRSQNYLEQPMVLRGKGYTIEP